MKWLTDRARAVSVEATGMAMGLKVVMMVRREGAARVEVPGAESLRCAYVSYKRLVSARPRADRAQTRWEVAIWLRQAALQAIAAGADVALQHKHDAAARAALLYPCVGAALTVIIGVWLRR